MEAPLFFWSQAKSAEQLISKIIFPTQYSDVTALIKNERASPQNAKLNIFLRLKLYLKSETNFFFLTGFYWLTGLKKLAARAPPRHYFSGANKKVYKKR